MVRDGRLDEIVATAGSSPPGSTIQEGQHRLSERWRAVPRVFRSVLVFLVTSFLTNAIVTIIIQNTTIKVDQTQQWCLNVFVAALLSILFWVWDLGQVSLLQLTKRYEIQERQMNAAYERGLESLRNALLGSETGNLYANLASRVSELFGDENAKPGERLDEQAVSEVKGILQRLRTNKGWYPILTHLLLGQVTDLRNGRFSLSLETYLDIYLDLIRLYIDRAPRRKHLHIWSFTNAIPTDWVAGDSSVSGNIMKRFADDKKILIDKMRQAGHVMRMISIVRDGATPAVAGIRSVEELRQAWACVGEENRSKYLTQLHTAPHEAFVARLRLNDLKFFDGLAEFIFFGFGDDSITWDLCIAGGFSSQNQVLRACYLFLAQDDGNRLLINIENKQRLKAQQDMSVPTRLQVSFKDWPRFAFVDKGYGAIVIEPYENLLPFAAKWKLAAEIWHTDKEGEQIRTLLDGVLRDKFDVLDAAAGTGFHCEILKRLEKQVSALEASRQEMELLRQSSAGQNVAIIPGDWRTLPEDLKGRTFEAIICLGTSIPYHSSWEDSRAERPSSQASSRSTAPTGSDQEAVLRKVVSNFRLATKPGGVLVLGLSRHNEKNRNGVTVEYKRDLNGVSYDMQWRFDFDWQARTRMWYSTIRGNNGEEYVFEVAGHLFDHDDLAAICREHFSQVELRDIGADHYDKYLVCKA